MALKKNCNYCGEFISIRKMPHGKHVAFDYNTDNPHNKNCKKKLTDNIDNIKKQSDHKLQSKIKKELDEVVSVSKKHEEENIIESIIKDNESYTETSNHKIQNEKNDFKPSFEIENSEKKINFNYVIIALLAAIIIFLLVK